MCWLCALRPKERRGSRPRCLALTEGDRGTVAARLESLVNLPDVRVTESDFWMPLGPPVRNEDGIWDPSPAREPKLGEDEGFLGERDRARLTDWWLAVSRGANTPNWDIASTATICRKRGFLLVEAKAHTGELRDAEAGKPLQPPVASNSRRNHIRIGACIQEASVALAGETRRPWALSRDWNYQMSNRFSWSWKLAEMGYPVVLVYLGFLNAGEMVRAGKVPFSSAEQWTRLVKEHSAPLFTGDIWNNHWSPHGHAFFPLIRWTSVSLPVHQGSEDIEADAREAGPEGPGAA